LRRVLRMAMAPPRGFARVARGTQVAVIALLAIAALAPRAACARATPQLTITLTPARAAANGDIPYVDVRVVAPDVAVPSGRPLLRLPLVSSNVTSVASALVNLRVTDSRAPLSLTTRDDPPRA
jgi:hypothetical protein